MTTENFCFYLQNRLIQTSQTGGQWYRDASRFSIPWRCSTWVGFDRIQNYKNALERLTRDKNSSLFRPFVTKPKEINTTPELK